MKDHVLRQRRAAADSSPVFGAPTVSSRDGSTLVFAALPNAQILFVLATSLSSMFLQQ